MIKSVTPILSTLRRIAETNGNFKQNTFIFIFLVG